MRGAAAGVVLAAALMGAASAEAPERSLRPQASPAAEAPSQVGSTKAATAVSTAAAAAVRTVTEQIPTAQRSLLAPSAVSVRPAPRPMVRMAAAEPEGGTAEPRRAAAAPAPERSGPGLLAEILDGGASGPSPAPEPTIVSEGPPEDEAERVVSASAAAVARAARPEERPQGLGALFRRVAQPAPNYPAKGSVCGVREIRGVAVGDINGSGACDITDAAKITEISGVKLSTTATIDCTTARALNAWVAESVKPSVGKRGGGVVGLTVLSHYSCRTRNNQPGARLSEHGKGRAIDIAAFQLADGSAISVLRDWRDRNAGPVLRRMHQAACGPFGTVLGPNADRFHQNHFHLDTARYRSGSYCR